VNLGQPVGGYGEKRMVELGACERFDLVGRKKGHYHGRFAIAPARMDGYQHVAFITI
jgi:hypothetical protein